MKRFLIALSLVTAFLFATGCDIDVNYSVDARADLITMSQEIVHTQTITFEPYTHYSLADYELEEIFRALIKGYRTDFNTASLYLDIRDNITGQPLRNEEYSVILESNGRYSFALVTY